MNAMMAKVGAAASDIQSAARVARRPCFSPLGFIRDTLPQQV
jgi:hypothetical protein